MIHELRLVVTADDYDEAVAFYDKQQDEMSNTARSSALRPLAEQYKQLGDTVILMPPLTVTSPELHRIVSTLAESIVEVTSP